MADTNERLQQAIAAARAGKTSEAKVIAEELIEEDPENPHALFLLGMLAGSEDEQREYMLKVLEIDPEHKAAKKRMAQLEPAEDVIVEEPAEEVVEAEAQEFEPEAQEFEPEPLDETVITAAAIGQEITGEEAAEEMEEAPFDLADEPFMEEIAEEIEEVEEEPEFGLAETVVGAAVASEALESELPEVEEDIPDWLFEEARSEEDLLEIDETQLWADEPVPVDEDLPDWLQEETADDFDEVQSEEELVFVPDETDEPLIEDEVGAAVTVVAADVASDMEEEPIEEEPAQPEQLKKKSANRGLEILLVILIIIALIIVVALGYLIITTPF